MTLSFDLTVHRDEFTLRASNSIARGEVIAILGPNGSGKSTLARSLCGLEAIDAGTITIDGCVVDDPVAGIFVSPEHRRLGAMLQGDTLFGHLSALENVAFGPRSRGVDRRTARLHARSWLERLGVDDLADRRPPSLSGGQAQRVALARALAAEPRLLVLDEPMSALDARVRADIRRMLRTHLDTHPITTVLITHDPIDAHVLADRVLVIEDGGVTQAGTLDEVTGRPRSRHVADMIGRTVVEGTIRSGVLTTDGGARVVVRPDAPDGRALAVITPASVVLHTTRPEGSSRNVWSMQVVAIDRAPDHVRVRLDGELELVSELTPAGADALATTVGGMLWASLKASEITIVPG